MRAIRDWLVDVVLVLVLSAALCSLACGQTLEWDNRSEAVTQYYVIDLDKMWDARIDVMRATDDELRAECLRLRQGLRQYRVEGVR